MDNYKAIIAISSGKWYNIIKFILNLLISLIYFKNYINSYINDINGTSNIMIPSWIPDRINQINGTVQLKLICGADLLESFAVPGLWKEEDVCLFKMIYVTLL